MNPLNTSITRNSSAAGKRGQAAIEFMMTYGWALFIILTVTIIAWQWGLFTVGGNVKAGYVGYWGVVPVDFILYESGDFVVALKNNVGNDITIHEVSMELLDSTYNSSFTQTISTGGIAVVNFSNGTCTTSCSGENTGFGLWLYRPGKSLAGQRFDLDMVVVYTDDRLPTKLQSTGQLWGPITPGSL